MINDQGKDEGISKADWINKTQRLVVLLSVEIKGVALVFQQKDKNPFAKLFNTNNCQIISNI